MNDARREALAKAADAVGKLFEHFGDRALLGRAFAVLLFSPEPLDAAALGRALGISAGAVSMTLRELVDMGLAHRGHAEGSRRFSYTAEGDLWVVATRFFQDRTRQRIEGVLRELKDAEQRLAALATEGPAGDGATFALEQTRRLVVIGEFVLGFMEALMERTRGEFKAVQKWLSVSGRLGGEPLSRLRRAINASRLEKRRRG